MLTLGNVPGPPRFTVRQATKSWAWDWERGRLAIKVSVLGEGALLQANSFYNLPSFCSDSTTPCLLHEATLCIIMHIFLVLS